MKLRTGTPLWLDAKTPAPRAARLRNSTTCDVAVIGAGITGALVARELLAAGLDVVVLDKARAGYGSTAASTGLLLYQTDTSLAELTKRHGRHTARRVYELGRQAVRELGAITRTLSAECHWQPKRTLYVASRPGDARPLRAEARRTRRIAFPVELLTRADLAARFSIDFPAALESPGSAQVNPFAFTQAVLRHCGRQRHFRLFQSTRVRRVSETPDEVTLETDLGHTIRARHVIVATGYEARPYLARHQVRLHSTYVIASPRLSPAQLKPLRALMWETARPYFYLRTTADHRVIFGGLDDPFSTPSRRRRRLPAKARELERMFATHFPALAFRAEFAWCGAFAETPDGLPCIGPRHTGSRVFYALGYGGNGITFSQIAARLLRETCLGRRPRDLALFAPDRRPAERR